MLNGRTSRSGLKSAGFTIIELMIVIAIVGILAAFSMPMLQDLIVSGQVRSAAMDIYSSMTFARSEAIKRNTTVTITPAGDWKSGWSITADGVADILAAHDPLPANLDSLGGATVTYTRDGRLTSGADFVLNVAVSGNTNVSMRCVTARASGQPNIRIDTNRDGNCNNG